MRFYFYPLVLGLLLTSSFLNADPTANLSEFRECMKNVDMQKLEAVLEKSQAFDAKAKQACAAGNRKGAEQVVLEFKAMIEKSPDWQQMQKCSAMMTGEIDVTGVDICGDV